MKLLLVYLLSLAAFCATGAVGCHARRKSWLAAVCALCCVVWTALMLSVVLDWLAP